jgi:hypothetical protein
MYKSLYCTLYCTYMTYRVSISERTMERLRECAKEIWGTGDITGTIGLPGHGGVTVEDVIVQMLEKEGF